MHGPRGKWTLHGRLSMTMTCVIHILRLLICAVLLMPSCADDSAISSRLPQHIVLNATLQLDNPPVIMDLLSFHWEHNKRPLVEYKNGNLTFHSSRVVMSMEWLKQGNLTLILRNLTTKDSGSYKCVIHYGGKRHIVLYSLTIEYTRIRILNLTLPQNKSDKSASRRQHPNLQMAEALAAKRKDDSIVLESVPHYRTLKYGLVSGVVAVTGFLVVFVYFCFEG
ncbi:uncharacterized protein RB166_016709 [Leptodactylus fuscus]|uniref:uncharacterized protein LOC142216407 n=1 Tax=Leptodactylus fuscus TaxID=238119 RepID=UPI003F4F1FDB